MSTPDTARDELILEVARLIWRSGITIGEFYETLGIDLDDLQRSSPEDVIPQISGIFQGWRDPIGDNDK